MIDFIKYFFLFIGLCVMVFLVLILFNIFTKSYKPRNSIAILILIFALFLVNGVLALSNLNTVLNNLGAEGIGTPKLPTTPSIQTGGSNGGKF